MSQIIDQISWQKISTVRILNLADLKKFAHELHQLLPARAVIALKGPMAAGKTELVKMFCSGLGIDEVSSPTFALHQHYESGGENVEHLDLFRIESEDELESAGFWDLFLGNENRKIFIEWPEKMRLDQIGNDWPLYKIEFQVDEQDRIVTLFQRLKIIVKK